MHVPGNDSKAAALASGPPAPDADTMARWTEGQRRARMLAGLWEEDLRRHLGKEYTPLRRRMQGAPDLSKNLFRSVITQLAVMYDRPPIIEHADPVAAEALRRVTSQAGMWQLAIAHQQSVLALREGAYRFDIPPESGKLLIRLIPGYLLWAESHPHDPDQPVTVHEYRLRCIEGKDTWTRDVLSVADLEAPVYRVESADGDQDLTEQVLGSQMSGEAYPYRYQDGTPFLPIVLYHAKRTGELWDAYNGIELVDGSLVVAGLWTQWRHMVRSASWPQRYAINVKVDGAAANPSTGDVAVETDPTTLLSLQPRTPGVPATVGQFQPGGNPSDLGAAIRDYAADVASEFDMSPSDVRRAHTDARSGYSIEISREGKRTAQRRLEPQFARGDSQSMGVIAALLNIYLPGLNLPETGYTVSYLGLPLGMEERKLLMEDHKMRAELGATSLPRLIAKLEGVTIEEARQIAREIQAENAEFGSLRAPAPPSTPDLPTPNPSEDI